MSATQKVQKLNAYAVYLILSGADALFLSTIVTVNLVYQATVVGLNPLQPVMPLYDRECVRSLVACPRPEWLWRHLLTGNSPASFEYRPFQIIETTDGRAVGYVAPSQELWDTMYVIAEFAVVEGQSLRAVTPTLLRGLKAMGEAEAAKQKKTVNSLYFSLGREHPVYNAAPDLLLKERPPYGWYIRVADVPAFLRHIAPALTARLARSPLTGQSGELKISRRANYPGRCVVHRQRGRARRIGRSEWLRQDDAPAHHCGARAT